MASCKDCMHNEACSIFAGDLGEDGAEKCECFKHRADVQEVRHGEWCHIGGDEWCCSCCGYVVSTEGSWEKPTMKYCSECGAKMDKERENND